MNDLVMALPVESQSSASELRLATVGKTVEEVKDQISNILRTVGLSVLYVSVANSLDNPEVQCYGRLRNAPWPETKRRYDSKVFVRVDQGHKTYESLKHRSEYNSVNVELRTWEPGTTAGFELYGHWRLEKLVSIFTHSRDDAWQVAALIDQLLTVDSTPV